MQRVALVLGARTPFAKAGGALAGYRAVDLAQICLTQISERLSQLGPFEQVVDEVVLSSVLHDPRVPNLAREAIIRSSLSPLINGHTVTNNCISGLVAAAVIVDGIKAGRIRAGIAGGVESMSSPSLSLSYEAERFFIKLSGLKTFQDRLKQLLSFRPGYVIPFPPSPKEPSTGLTMGEHCELMAKEFGISRKEQDEWALESHLKASAAVKESLFSEELIALPELKHDDLVRSKTSLERLAGLRTVFDRSATGTLTAGNSSALTDGGSVVFLASEERAKELSLKPQAFIDDIVFTSVDPQDGLLMAPARAIPALLARNSLSVSDVDFFEIHEAFAAQVLCNLRAWEEGWARYDDCQPLGLFPRERINIFGGSLALGHPFAATGGRLILSLGRILNLRSGSKGVISVCAAGGMGAALLMSAP